MAIIELAGTLHEKFDSEYVGKKETFQKRIFILEETNASGGKVYTELIKFVLVGDSCNELDKFSVMDRIYVKAVIKGNKWLSKKDDKVLWFTELRALGITPADPDGYGNVEKDDNPESIFINPLDADFTEEIAELKKKNPEPKLFDNEPDDLPFALMIPLAIGFLTQFMI